MPWRFGGPLPKGFGSFDEGVFAIRCKNRVRNLSLASTIRCLRSSVIIRGTFMVGRALLSQGRPRILSVDIVRHLEKLLDGNR